MLHGTGKFTDPFIINLLVFHVGKCSSPMKHLGLITQRAGDTVRFAGMVGRFSDGNQPNNFFQLKS